MTTPKRPRWKPLSLLVLSAALIGRRRRKSNTDTEKDLVIEEYKACRELIGKNIEIIERNEVFVIGACAAVIVFTIDKGNNLLTFGAAWLPLVLTWIGKKRYEALDATIALIDGYIKTQERLYEVINYTQYYEKHNPNHQLGRARLKVWTVLGWAMLAFALYKSYAIVNPLQGVCDTYPKIAFLCRPTEPSKN